MPRLTHRRYRAALVGVIAASLVQAAVIVLSALTVRAVFDRVLNGAAGEPLPWAPLVALAVLALGGAAAVWLFRVCAWRLGNDYVHDLRLVMFDGLAAEVRTVSAEKRREHGIQVVRFSNDLNAIRQWISLGLAQGLSASVFLAGVLIAMTWLYAPLALAVGVVLVASVLLAWWIGARMERIVARTRRRRGRLAVRVSESVGQLEQLLLFGRVGRERNRLERASERLQRALRNRALWTGALRATMELSIRASLLIVIAAGSLALHAGRIDAASVVALVSIAGLVGTPVRHLGRVLEYWRAGRVARRMIEPLVRVGESAAMPRRMPRGPRGRVRLDPLTARTLRIEQQLTIEPGQRVALWSANGSGKSTLLSLLAGQLRPERGRVRVDGVDPARMQLRARARLIATAAADQALLRGSIGKNVRMRIAGAPDTEVERACAAAGLDELLERLPDGLKTRVGGRGTRLSTGEQARVKLARALLGQPRLLLLDEIEAGLDGPGMRQLQQVVATYPGTVVFATHDQTLLRLADRVWVMDDGVCRDQPEPTHQEVVS